MMAFLWFWPVHSDDDDDAGADLIFQDVVVGKNFGSIHFQQIASKRLFSKLF